MMRILTALILMLSLGLMTYAIEANASSEPSLVAVDVSCVDDVVSKLEKRASDYCQTQTPGSAVENKIFRFEQTTVYTDQCSTDGQYHDNVVVYLGRIDFDCL